VAAVALVAIGLVLEAYQVMTAVSSSQQLPGVVDLAQNGGEDQDIRHSVLKDIVQVLTPSERGRMVSILRESLHTNQTHTNPKENKNDAGKSSSSSSSSSSSTTTTTTAVSTSDESSIKFELPPKVVKKEPEQPHKEKPKEKKPPTTSESGEGGKTIQVDLGGDPGSMPLSHGLQGGSRVVLEGTFLGGCFALELMDKDSKNIQHHLNFRPKRGQVVSSTYLGGWGTEYVHSGMPLEEQQKFSVVLDIIKPAEERQPWTLSAKANGKTVFESLLIPDFFLVKKVRVHDGCSKQAHNKYDVLKVVGAPKDALEPPKMEFNEKVTPEGPSEKTIMLIGVLSAPKNQKQRGSQRRSWLNHKFCTSGEGLVRFFVGKSGNERIDNMVIEENKKTGDIIILPDHKEDYYNIAGKTAAMVHYAVNTGVKFLLKCDDDTYVDVDQIRQGISGAGGGLVLAAITYNGGAQRSGKWAMPTSDYAPSRYPPFPHGPGYVIGIDILKHAHKKLNAGTLRPLALEDVSMGVWIDDARKNGIHVNYQSRKGSSRGSVNIGGCHPGAMISHYMLPEQMVCMWDKQQRGESNLCC